jgi:hypothetical protein
VAREQEEKRLKKQLEEEQEQQRKLQEHKLYLEQTVSQPTFEHQQVSCQLLRLAVIHKCLIVHEPALENLLFKIKERTMVNVQNCDGYLLAAVGPGVYSASNRNEYQKHKSNVSGE